MNNLSNYNPEQKIVLYLTVAINRLLAYLKSDAIPVRTDVAIKNENGIQFWSVTDETLRTLHKQNYVLSTTFEDPVESGQYKHIPSYGEIKNLFQRQIEDPKYRYYSLLCDPRYVGEWEKTKVYAAPIGRKGIIHTEFFEILFGCFISRFRKEIMETPWDVMEPELPEGDKEWYELSRETIVRFLANKIYVNSKDKRGEELYETLCLVSSASYEKAPNHGRLGLLTEGTEEKAAFIRFSQSVDIDREHVRQIRKLLEMSDRRNMLMIEKGKISGIFTPKNTFNNTTISFQGNGKWDFSIRGKPVIFFDSVCFGLGNRATDQKSREKIENVFGSDCDLLKLITIINEAKKQPHGTTIIITDKAVDESDRLSSHFRAIKIDPVITERETMRSITAIDGAVIINPEGKCYALGAILDGESGKHGDMSRGARYNSAITYVDYWRKKRGDKILAVIVSADESLDFYPEN